MGSVVVGYFDVVLQAIFPAESNSPLLIDSNTPEASQISLELLQLIAGGNAKILNNSGLIDHPEFPAGPLLNIAWQFGHPKPRINFSGIRIAEALDHRRRIAPQVITSNVIICRGVILIEYLSSQSR